MHLKSAIGLSGGAELFAVYDVPPLYTPEAYQLLIS